MSKRAILKTIAFVCGLYFVLEFILPEKYGGDFDGHEVHSPAPVPMPSGAGVLYVGQVGAQQASLGRLVADAAGGWRREPDQPVMQRSLFSPCEKSGMRQLAAVADPAGINLFYIGLDTRQRATLCHARGDAAGLAWQRSGPLRFAVGGRTEPTVDEPNGRLPGTLEAFAVAAEAPDAWRMLLVLKRAGHGQELWEARGGPEPTRLRLAAAPLPGGSDLPAGFAAFDARFDAGTDTWNLFFAGEGGGTNLLLQAGVFAGGAPFAVRSSGVLTGLRLDADGRAFAACRETAPDGVSRSVLVADATGTPRPIKTVGRPARSTYLSDGILLAGNYLQIIGAFAVFIALINLTLFHGKRVAQRQSGSFNSTVFFVFLVAMGLFTFLGKSEAAAGTFWRHGYDLLFEAVVRPLGTAVFSMITFYMISAAYRSFRIRSVEAALLMLSACIVMVGQMPIGAWFGALLPDSLVCLQLPWLADKLLTVVNACAYRGVLIGLVVGGISISLRIWLGLDNTVYAGLEGKR
jgi:hypothetical protein